MAELAGDDPFDLDDYEFCYDPFDSEGGDGVGEGLCCFSSPDGYGYGGGGDMLVVEGRVPRSAPAEPTAQTLGRSFASGGGFSRFFPNPRLVPARGISEDFSEEEGDEVSGDGGRCVGYALSWFGGGRRPIIEVSSSDDDDDDSGLGATFRMRLTAEDTDSDDGEFLDALPASRSAVEGLPEVALGEEEASRGCAVCKDGIAAGERAVRLPCKHCFHGGCIRPWLAIRNTCPVWRFELPTGNAECDRRRRRADGAPVAQQGTLVQSGGTGAGATTVGEDATGCPAEN